MTTASQILVLGGLANLAYGLLNGFALARSRLASPEAPKYLVFAHVGALMQGPMLLGLVWAVELSDLRAGVETFAAALLVASSFVLLAKDTLNWLSGVNDEFVERPWGFYLGGLSALLAVAGLAILIVGAI